MATIVQQGSVIGAENMRGVNLYADELTPEQVQARWHREVVGGVWDVMGPVELEVLKEWGLQPQHKLLDLGCGSLRGGLHIVRYLDKDNYVGNDINRSLLDGGEIELQDAGLMDKGARLVETAAFETLAPDNHFDYAIAFSVFTHIFMNHIMLALKETARTLKSGGVLYSTFFNAPETAFVPEIKKARSGERLEFATSYLHDPFHYSVDEMTSAGHLVGLRCEGMVPWRFSEGQQMLRFVKP
jgi:SAM-dependent methyltransferase